MTETKKKKTAVKKPAAKKQSSKKKKKKTGGTPVVLIIIIILLVLALAAVLVVLFIPDYNKKIKDYGNKIFTTTAYEEYVIKYSYENGVDPRFTFGVINTESHFDPKATSDVGARGLMQIMEDAYNWIRFRKDDQREHSFDDMYDPELNIEYGTYYLGYLYERYGSYELTAAAYHAGFNAVDSWIEDGRVDPDDFRIEDIPASDTAHYIDKVMSAYNNYKNNSAIDSLEEELKNG